MAYEDPNAPSPTFDGFAQEPKSSVDQSKSFLGGATSPMEATVRADGGHLHRRVSVVTSVDIRVERDDA